MFCNNVKSALSDRSTRAFLKDSTGRVQSDLDQKSKLDGEEGGFREETPKGPTYQNAVCL